MDVFFGALQSRRDFMRNAGILGAAGVLGAGLPNSALAQGKPVRGGVLSLVTTGVSGANITSVTPVSGSNGAQYTITVNTGVGEGTIAMSFSGAGIEDLARNPLPGGMFVGITMILNMLFAHVRWVLQLKGKPTTMLVGTGLVALMYRYLPARRLAWRHVLTGALVTALLFHLGRWAIGLYLGRATQPTAYGAAASFAALLLWLYYSAQIFLFGAITTRMYSDFRRERRRRRTR